MSPTDARYMVQLELDAMAQSPLASQSQSQAYQEAKRALRAERYGFAAGWLESYYLDLAEGMSVARAALVAEERGK